VEIDVEERGDAVIVTPEDRLDLLGYLELEEALGELVREGHRRLVLDLQSVGFMNSTAMAVVHRYSLQTKEMGGGLVLANANRSVQGVLDLGGLSELVTICETVDAAVKALAARKKDETDKHKTGGQPAGSTDTKTA